jgi:hypothetical protein
MHFDAFKHIFRKVILVKKKFLLGGSWQSTVVEIIFEAIQSLFILFLRHYR